MSIQIFRRVEQKYLLNNDEYKKIMKIIGNHIIKDKYFESKILNIYFDSDNYDLIINSLEKPIYKEKIRLRSYDKPTLNDKVFLEIKNKYHGVVGKRRVEVTLKEFNDYIEKGIIPNTNLQIMSEIDYCFKKYNLKPKFFLGYDRLSYYDKDNKEFRITFDKNIRSRNNNLKLEYGDIGEKYFKEDMYIMEIKSLNSIPLWFTKILSELKIYPVSFSKIGNIYKESIKEEIYV